MNDLKFGWGNKNTHNPCCHQGILPLCGPPSLHGPTNKTPQDPWPGKGRSCLFVYRRSQGSTGRQAGCSMTSCHGMTNLLKRYICLLTVLFGVDCSQHLAEVQGVYQLLAEKIAVYELMSAELIVETLWRPGSASATYVRIC